LIESGDNASIVIEDNGRGLPVKERDRLTEPYVTTRSKGTGLGLAIVSRIVEQHAGTLRLVDRDDGVGARVSIVLPSDPQAHESTVHRAGQSAGQDG
jgi:two-component system nitrogen regulation sensor histidine kinase NtrY